MPSCFLLALLIHIIFGCLVVFLHGPFYGDAFNFYAYANNFRSTPGLLQWTDLTSVNDFNVAFVTLLYGNLVPPLIVNILCLFSFSLFVLKQKIYFRANLISSSSLTKYYIAFYFLLLSPSILVRLGEPSREYLLSFLLFLLGYLFSINKRGLLFFLVLLLAILIRPVSAPIYLLWLTFFWSIHRGITVKCLLLTSFVFLLALLPSLPLLQFYNDKLSAYQGSLLPSSNIFLKSFFNVFGDINSFATDRYPLLDRLVFFLDYLWRILLIIWLLSRNFWITTLFILFSSLLFSTAYPFPHPRYFVPTLFFLSGSICINRSIQACPPVPTTPH